MLFITIDAAVQGVSTMQARDDLSRLPQRCRRCGGPMYIAYEDERVCLLCGEVWYPPAPTERRGEGARVAASGPEQLARRAEGHPGFIGYALAAYRRHYGLDDAALAAWLGISPRQLAYLALYRRPDPLDPAFEAVVERIAAATGCRAERLAALLRQVG